MKYLNDSIEDSYSLFTRMKSKLTTASLVTLVGVMMGVGVYGCKKEEPQKEDTSPKQSFEQKLEEELLLKYTKIVFISARDGNPEIYVMNADGSEQKNLSHSPAGAIAPVWSPDGKKIAFQSVKDGNTEIYVMNADGSEQKNLTNNPAQDKYPSWSPDGKKIAFVSDKEGTNIVPNAIYVMNTDGQDIRRLTYSDIGSFVSSFPSWSPNGKRIAFHSYRDRNHDIYVMKADGSEQKNLTNNPAYNDHPFWSPDGKKIAFISLRDGSAAQMTPDQRREIYVMNADGSEQRNLTNNTA